MIKTVGEMVASFIENGREICDQFDVEHCPTIGDMYEGLTAEALERALPIDRLTVSKGFVRNSAGDKSRQIDVILAVGEGEPVPHTNHRVHLFADVIAIIEVKKNLNPVELASAHENQRSVLSKFEPRTLRTSLFDDAWRSISRQPVPMMEDVKQLPVGLRHLYHALLLESAQPVRIVLGYHGYKTEVGLRKAYFDFISSKEGEMGFGPASLPNLIAGEDACLLKLDGMPFASPLNGEHWPLMASRRGKPIGLILELIWTRLSYFHGLPPESFGEDLDIEAVNLMLTTKAVEDDGRLGWLYGYVKESKGRLQVIPSFHKWEPTFLDDAQSIMVGMLCEQDVNLDEGGLAEFALLHGYTLDALVSSLVATGLVYQNGQTLGLLTDECGLVILPDGRTCAAENKSGRLLRWASRFKTASRSDDGI